MMTNREAYMKELEDMCVEDFVEEFNSYDHFKCMHCSNYYSDTLGPCCHKDLNDSTCEKGQVEYFESDKDEDLIFKYPDKRRYGSRAKIRRFLMKWYETGMYHPQDYNSENCKDCEFVDKCSVQVCIYQTNWLEDEYKTFLEDLQRLGELPVTIEHYIYNIFIPELLNKDAKIAANRCWVFCFENNKEV